MIRALTLCLILSHFAFAADTPPPPPPVDWDAGAQPPPAPKAAAGAITHNLNVDGIGEVTITIEDQTDPAAVDSPLQITPTLKCIGSTVERKMGAPIGACSFEGARYDRSLKRLNIKYKRNILDEDDGTLKCKGDKSAQRKLDCNAPAAALKSK